MRGCSPVDPWRDYLAIHHRSALLVIQFASLFDRRGWRRWKVSLGCTAAVAAMFFYVESIPLRAIYEAGARPYFYAA